MAGEFRRAVALVLSVFALCLGLAAAPSASQAQAAEDARAFFASGQAFFDAGRYEEALADFSRAQALNPHPAILFNVAVCYERLGRDVDAFEALEDVVADARLDEAARARAQERLASVRGRVVQIEVTGAADMHARLREDADWCTVPCRWVVLPGPQRLLLEDSSGGWERAVDGRAGATLTLAIESRERTVVLGADPGTETELEAPSARPSRPVLEAGPLAAVGTTVTVLGVATAIIALVLVSDLHDQFERGGRICTGSLCQDGVALNIVTNVGWAVALVGGILAGIDLFAMDHGSEAALVEAMSGRFHF